MASRNPDRLRRYLEMISRKRGGLEGALSALDAAQAEGVAAGGFEGLRPLTDDKVGLAREGVRKLERGREPDPAEIDGMEAIILPLLRPAIDVADGSFGKIAHPLWSHLSSDRTLRARIEAVMPSIGRIELPGHPRLPFGGTGFVVGPGLVMTNRHVAEIFASGLGDRNLVFRPNLKAGIDFLRERDRRTGPILAVRRVVMIHPFWDVAILSVDGLPADRQALRLSVRDARDLAGHDIVVVGYPAFDPRNPTDVQTDLFRGEFGVKRLQPGELQGGFNTGSFGKVVPAATHDCSTLGGNSGSAVIDLDNGEVLAVHFGGLFEERNYGVPAFALSRDARVVDSGILFAGAPAGGPNDWGDWWRRADASEAAQPSPSTPSSASPQPANPPPEQGSVATASNGSVTIEIPLRITVSLGEPARSAAPDRTVETSEEDTREKLVEPFHEPADQHRRGYDEGFLDPGAAAGRTPFAVPMPTARDPAVLARTESGEDVLHYQNFSIRMHAERRLALVCASNVTEEPALREPEPGRDYRRRALSGLGKNDREKWFLDPRLPARFQLPDAFFTKDKGAFDKGHLVRRDDVAWGPTYDELRRANGDTYHVTNCSPQVMAFNQSAKGADNWGDLENVVLGEAASERLCLLAGPVLDPADETFVSVGDDGLHIRAKIPARYWKVVVARVEEGLAAYGFVLEQDLSDVQTEFVVPEAFQAALTSLEEIEAMAGIVFDPALKAADQFATSRADEVTRRSGGRVRRRPERRAERRP